MKRLVLLGTGTGVGKTRFGTALASALGRGAPVQALKPLETGVVLRPGGAPPPGSDAAHLEEASFHVQPVRPHPLLAFPDPVSPHLAARRLGVSVSPAALAQWADQAARSAGPALAFQIIETAGGAFSPLSDSSTNVDLALALEPAIWILVAPDSLGVLHDVHTCWLALRHRAREPDVLVLNASRPPDASTGTNADELPRLSMPAPLAVIGRDATPDLARLLRHLDSG